MTDPLSAEQLLAHVTALAGEIGPRPVGGTGEILARAYIRRQLLQAGLSAAQLTEQPFRAPDTWGYLFAAPIGLTLLGNLIGKLGGGPGKLIGGALSLLSAYHLWQSSASQRQPLAPLYPKRPTANLIARLPPREQVKHRVVLIGHVDTNKARLTFATLVKQRLPMLIAAGTLLPAFNAAALISRALNGRRKARLTQRLTVLSLLSFIPLLLLDERGPYVPGANDNASAVACLLGLGAYLQQAPLAHTEVWLAFTGAEEVGGLGVHHLLDQCGAELRDAYFIDLEMVGARDIVYVLDHGVSYLKPYGPDRASLELAYKASQQHTTRRVVGRSLVTVDEVGALRGRGYRGICLAGVDEYGWPPNWHRATDTVENIEPAGLETAARFALGMMQVLDEGE